MVPIRSAAGLCLLLFAAATLPAQGIFHPPATSAHEFPLMAWGDSPSDPAQLRLMREAGLNISGFCEAADLQMVRAAGLSCFVRDPRLRAYRWDAMPPPALLRANLAPLARTVLEHPAALGFFLYDDPSVASYPGLARMAGVLSELAPGKWSYINLLPNYAIPARRGTADYEAYVREYLRCVHPAVLSYNNYSLLDGRMDDRFYANLEIIRRLALQAGIPFWSAVLSNSYYDYMEPTDATLRLQVYSTLAYGGRGIEYFSYVARDIGDYRASAVDAFGHRTATWYMLRRVNDEVRTLAPWLVKLRSTGVYHSAPLPPRSKPISASPLVERIQAQTSGAAAHFLLGEFTDEHGAPYLMLVNEDLTRSLNFQIKLRAAGAALRRISAYSGTLQPLDPAMEWLAPGAGMLLQVGR